MKKVLALILASVMILSTFVACEKKDFEKDSLENDREEIEEKEESEEAAEDQDGTGGGNGGVSGNDSGENNDNSSNIGNSSGDGNKENEQKDDNSNKNNDNNSASDTQDPSITESTAGLKFKLNPDEKSYTLVGIGTCTEKEIVISRHNDLPVTIIGQSAFYECDNLTSITIPNSITSIGRAAFYNCDGLTSITIPNGVTSIGIRAFLFCDGLENIYYDGNVVSWCNINFEGATANPMYNINAKKFYIKESGTNEYKLLTNLIIPNSVTKIKTYAFYNCNSLTSITIPNSVTSIGDFAFYDCYNLTNITIGNRVMSIGESAFRNCNSLTSMTVPDSVTSIGELAFEGCQALTNIYYDGDIASWCNISFNGYAANPASITNTIKLYIKKLETNEYELLTKTVIPDSVTEIKAYTFYNCSNLTSITIPNSVTSIGDYAFTSCYNLTNVTIGNNVKSIGTSVFSHCEALAFVIIPDSVISINTYAFAYCKNLKSVTIGKNVTSIGDYAFYDCYEIVEVINKSLLTITKESGSKVASHALEIHDGDSKIVDENEYLFYTTADGINYLIDYIGDDTEPTLPTNYNRENYVINSRAFYDNDMITKLTIPDSVESIGSSAFYDCDNLTSVTIGNRVESISNYAFRHCGKLTNVTIGKSVTNIGEDAFSNCSKLVEVINKSTTLTNVAPGSTANGYLAYYALKVHSGESEIKTQGDYQFYTVGIINYLFNYIGTDTEISLPANYNEEDYVIAAYMFYGNDKITNITIPDSVTNINQTAFFNCSNLKNITVDENNTMYKSINGNLYSKNEKTLIQYAIGKDATSFTIPNAVTSISENAFAYCNSLVSITLPNSVKNIDSSAFWHCDNLTSIKYRGTETQWINIEKGSYWDYDTGNYTITYNYTGE